MNPGVVRFHVVNFIKSDSLYNDGMQPLIWSEQTRLANKLEWHRDGFEIRYAMNHIDRVETDSKGNQINTGKLYTLTFKYDFKYANDTVYFAYNYPYTYTELTAYLDSLVYPSFMRRAEL